MTLQKKVLSNIPFEWVDLKSYRNSKGDRLEVYLSNEYSIEHLIFMFCDVFGKYKQDLVIYEDGWGNFCLDTWNINDNTFNYSSDNRSEESKKYLSMLEASNISPGYSGCCSCNDWDKYLRTTLNCIINHIAPYSHKIFHPNADFFFYFHHTYSIGMYYKQHNDTVNEILNKLNNSDYDIQL